MYMCVCALGDGAVGVQRPLPVAATASVPPQPAPRAPPSVATLTSLAEQVQMSDEEMSDREGAAGNKRGGASAHSGRKGAGDCERPAQQLQLVIAFESDAAIRSLRPALRASLRPAVESLHTAIHSEMVAHTLMLYRFTRLQQKLMAAKKWTRIRAARQLNPWIEAAYGEHGQELVARIRHDAHRLFDLFSEPADDDEWWPGQLAAMVQDGGRTKHLLEALLLLNRYHEPIRRFYDTEADRLQLVRFYLRTKKWTARQIEQDLIADGVIKPRKNKQRGSSAAVAAAAAGEADASASDNEVEAAAVEAGRDNGTLARAHVDEPALLSEQCLGECL